MALLRLYRGLIEAQVGIEALGRGDKAGALTQVADCPSKRMCLTYPQIGIENGQARAKKAIKPQLTPSATS